MGNKKNMDKIKQEPDTIDQTVTSEYLPELPSFIKSKIAAGKKISSGCICKHHNDVTVYLLEADLWKRFNQEGTEMIISKKGRRMFPVPSYVFCNLKPDKLYNVSMEIATVNNNTYKFTNGEWIQSKGTSDLHSNPGPGRSIYLHPNSPNTGLYWMDELVSFSGLKIGNNIETTSMIVLQSMRKYVLNLIIWELNGSMSVKITQPETEFMAVTQYQNGKVTQMKIEYNPFAHAFRFMAAKRREKTKRQLNQEADSENESTPEDISLSDFSSSSSKKKDLTNNVKSEKTIFPTPQLKAYLEKKRQTFKQLLPECLEQFNVSPSINDQAINFNMGSWSSSVMPYSNTMNSVSDTSNNFLVNPSQHCLMFPVGKENPLALVRQFGQVNQFSNTDMPLSLVTKKQSENHFSLEKFNNKNTNNCLGYLPSPENLTPDNLCMQNQYSIKEHNAQDLQSQLCNGQLSIYKPDPWLPTLSRPEVVLKNADLWATTPEVVISSEGRLMFPFISLFVTKLHPEHDYHIILKLVPNSPWVYNYDDHEWSPSMKAFPEKCKTVYPHPENPKSGHLWGNDVSFDRLRLSSHKKGKNMLKVQLRRQYLPVVVVKLENHRWKYPLKDAIFITVKMDRSPYQLSRSLVSCSISRIEESNNLNETTQRKQIENRMRNKDRMFGDSDGAWALVNLAAQSLPLNLKTTGTSQIRPLTPDQLPLASQILSSPAPSSCSLSISELVRHNDIDKTENKLACNQTSNDLKSSSLSNSISSDIHLSVSSESNSDDDRSSTLYIHEDEPIDITSDMD